MLGEEASVGVSFFFCMGGAEDRCRVQGVWLGVLVQWVGFLHEAGLMHESEDFRGWMPECQGHRNV